MKMGVKCDACGKWLHPGMAILYERALGGKKVDDSDAVIQRGFSCPDIDCLCEATGVADEVRRERAERD